MDLFMSLPAIHVLAVTAQCFAIPPAGGSACVLLFSLAFPCGASVVAVPERLPPS